MADDLANSRRHRRQVWHVTHGRVQPKGLDEEERVALGSPIYGADQLVARRVPCRRHQLPNCLLVETSHVEPSDDWLPGEIAKCPDESAATGNTDVPIGRHDQQRCLDDGTREERQQLE